MSRTERLEQPQQFGKYQLVARLTRGRLGDVYKAKSHGVEGFERVLVIKTIDTAMAAIPGFVDVIAEEAQRAVLLSHANVVQVLNLGQDEASGQAYIAMEFVHGMDLRRAIHVNQALQKPWPLELAIYIIAEVANGLDYAHRRKDYDFNKLNIMHRDISPFNIMLSSEGEAKLTDFGMARALAMAPVTNDNEAMRRVLYQAPEIIRGEPYTQRSDLFSLGLVFYELLTGFHPYRQASNSTQHLVELARHGVIPALPNRDTLPRPVVQLLESMLVSDQNGRIGSAGQVYEELVGFIYGNNLQRADARALGMFIQSLRDEELNLFPEQESKEAGIQEISLSELQVPENLNSFYGDLHPDSVVQDEDEADLTADALPKHKLQQVFRNDSAKQDQTSSPLPPKLQELLTVTRAGQGKAVLLHGRMGHGRDYIPDRLAELMSQHGNAMACAVQCLRDDEYRPFGIMGDMLAASILPQLPNEQCDLPHAIDKLEQLRVSPRAVEALSELWELAPSPTLLGVDTTRRLMVEACGAVIRDLCQRHTMIFIIDHVEYMDPLSVDVLKDIISHMGQFPSMVIMSTNSLELMRRTLDTGNPAHLETVRIVGGQEPPYQEHLQNLQGDALFIMMTLTVAQIALSQSDLIRLTGWPSDRLFAAVKDLVEFGLVRTPQPGVFLAGDEELLPWSQQPHLHAMRRQVASILCEFAARIEPPPSPLATLRFQAIAQRRRAFLSGSERHASALAQRGWLRTAMSLYQYLANVSHDAQLKAPQTRLNFMLARADLALDLALPDECQASIGPIQALAETLHNDRSIIRSQLLAGQVAMFQDDLEEARQLFARALDSSNALHDPDLLASSMVAMATWFERYGDIANGQRMIEGALNLHNRWGTRRMNLPARGQLMNLAVNMWCHRQMPSRAERLVEDLDRLAQNSRLAQLNCRLEWARGLVARAKQDYDGSIQTLKRAASIAAYHGLTALELDILRHLNHIMVNSKQPAEALPLLERLIQMSSFHKDQYTQLRALEMRALAHVLSGQHVDGALKQLEENLERALQRRVPKDIYRCHLFLKRAYRAVGRHQDAELHEQHAQHIARTMRYIYRSTA